MFGIQSTWINALLATSAISTLPNILLFLVPTNVLIGRKVPNALNIQNIFLCFSAAGLLGDIFLHILPHLLGTHSHSHAGGDGDQHDYFEHHDNTHVHYVHSHDEHDEHDHGHIHEEHSSRELRTQEHDVHDVGHGDNVLLFGLEKGLVIQLFVVLGFLLFMIAEKLANRHLSGGHSHSHDSRSSSSSSSNTNNHEDSGGDSSSNYINNNNNNNNNAGDALSLRSGKNLKKTGTATGSSANVNSTNSIAKATRTGFFSKLTRTLKASGWLNLLADSMHNFTDGVAIGTTFASAAGSTAGGGSGSGIALATFLSVICHEVPHEIGDFTILIQNGLSKGDAIAAQFLTAIAAVLGTVVGLVSQFHSSVQDLFLALTAGGFLYLATVTMLPSVVAENSSMKQIVFECIAFVAGICMMLVIALLE